MLLRIEPPVCPWCLLMSADYQSVNNLALLQVIDVRSSVDLTGFVLGQTLGWTCNEHKELKYIKLHSNDTLQKYVSFTIKLSHFDVVQLLYFKKYPYRLRKFLSYGLVLWGSAFDDVTEICAQIFRGFPGNFH